MQVALFQLDGKLPNLALMALARHHRERGDTVELRQVRRGDSVYLRLFDAKPDRVYASLIFEKTRPVVRELKRIYPDAVIGGTGWDLSTTLADHGVDANRLDYSDYPEFRQSVGFSQRGCRLNCGFCVVPKKEGKVKPNQTIAEIWRGEPWPRELLLLDNDFFGQPAWRDRIGEIRDGRFKVSFNQGINARMLSEEAAAAIASVDYRDDGMKDRRIYTAWDNVGDEAVLFRGLESLARHGVKPDHIAVYMLIGWNDAGESDWVYRVEQLQKFGCRPYPMPFRRNHLTRGFQRWAVRRASWNVPWPEFKAANCRPEKLPARESGRISLF